MGVRRPDKEYKVFQFPRTAIPRIDGDFSDWEIVPDSYSVGLSELYDTHGGRGARLDPREFDLTVKVGWVAGENRLYFYVEAYDDCWDFADEGLRQDIFELVVDADLSGGPFIKEDNGNRNKRRSRTFISKDTERMRRITISSLRYSPARIGLWCGARLRGSRTSPMRTWRTITISRKARAVRFAWSFGSPRSIMRL